MYPTFMVRDHGHWGRDQNGCMECCCESISLKPGVKSPISIIYAPWSVPIGRLHTQPQFILEAQNTCPVSVSGTNLPPQITPPKVAFDTQTNTVLTGDLKSQVTDPDGDPVTFKYQAGYGPAYGAVQVSSDGTFIYTPATSFTGVDRFFAAASDGINAPVVFEVVIGVSSPSGAASSTPSVSVVPTEVVIDYHRHTVTFPVVVTPAAQQCEVWKLNLLQDAIDCNCAVYRRTDCFDIRIAKC